MMELNEKKLATLISTKMNLWNWKCRKMVVLASGFCKIVESKQTSQVQKYYKKFILSAYGEKSNDGREFRKYDDDGRPLWRKFESTGAFHELYYKLMTDEDYAIKFINGIIGANTETPQIPADSKVITTNFNS